MSARRKTTIGCRAQYVPEIVAALMWGPKTVNDLCDITGAAENTIREWVAAFRRSGLVVVVGKLPRPVGSSGGRKAVVYGWQPKPFAVEDSR